MARGPEGAFWKRVRDAWPGHAVRVEASDGDVEAGTPDCVLSIGGRGGWIELKVWPDNVSGQQLTWHRDAIDRGAYAMVLSEVTEFVWLGPAEEYDRWIRRARGSKMVRPPDLRLLLDALNVIACALRRSSGG